MSDRPSIAVIDYRKGNLSSVARGLARAGADPIVTDEPDAIRQADGLLLPGVGSFYDAITFMVESGEAEAVLDKVAAGTPFLGICLGMQLLFDRGDEGVPLDVPTAAADGPLGSNLPAGTVFEADGTRWVRGLGALRGSCTRLDGRRLKVPHVGWDQVHLTGAAARSPLLGDFPEGANMYFTHSYAVDSDVEAADVAAVTHYTASFASSVAHGRVFGCQFHPEKSSTRGLHILKNYVSIVEGARA